MAAAPTPSGNAGHRVKSLKITILSTMLAEEGMGEWGFSALVEADGRRILFDTGLRPETVLQNARHLGIDLSGVTDVVLSHHHGDHTGGLLTLRRELAALGRRRAVVAATGSSFDASKGIDPLGLAQ
jgi:7,8-dihydropterin-6-yl-methyl-4-(beta-D-ribofuranosyl)aminobenzene 5'-phosphate synthase